MNWYVTANDAPGGVYKSQVTDVVRALESYHTDDWLLVALVPYNRYLKHRRTIVQWSPNAWVFPMLPGLRFWWLNVVFLFLPWLVHRPVKVIARGVFAWNICALLRSFRGFKHLVYDGRGAVFAECVEYALVPPSYFTMMQRLERKAVLQSEYRIAVSGALIEYWQREYLYAESRHVIIPCSLGLQFSDFELMSTLSVRKKLNWGLSDIVLVFSGGNADWQTITEVLQVMPQILSNNLKIKFLFLFSPSSELEALMEKFPGRINCGRVSPEEVPIWLSACDYGLLIRNNTVTNRVASPVKFAEYLAGGLSVIVSDSVSDFSAFVSSHHCGFVVKSTTEITNLPLTTRSVSERIANRALALEFFSKKSPVIWNSYLQVISAV